MLDQELINKINSIYNLGGEVEFLSVVKKGFLSENYVLKNKKRKFFLKKYRDLGLRRLKETHKVKKFFSDNHIPVIMPINTKNNKTFFVWDSSYYGLFPFVDGINLETNKMDRDEIKNCAELLAKIHLASRYKFPKLVEERSFAWDRDSFLKRTNIILNLIKNKKIKSAFDKKIEKHLLNKIKIASKNRIDYDDLKLKNDHLIHGDFHADNIFFDSRGNVLSVFDWDKNNQSPRVMEIVRAMRFICFHDKYNEINFKNAQIFLEKYNNIYPIDKDELMRGILAWYLNQLYTLWVMDEIYLRNNNKIKNLFKSYVAFLDYQSKNLEKFSERILSCF